LSVADLIDATVGGRTLVFGPIIGGVLGWLASRKQGFSTSSLLAVGINAVILTITAIAILLLGGS
jgi:hypothetical protein